MPGTDLLQNVEKSKTEKELLFSRRYRLGERWMFIDGWSDVVRARKERSMSSEDPVLDGGRDRLERGVHLYALSHAWCHRGAVLSASTL